MRPTVKIDFSDFWNGFDKKDNFFFNLLSKHYDLEISDNPDFLIYSAFGHKYLRYDCIRIFYTGENLRPDFTECDYAFSFDYSSDPRNYRLPLYALSANVKLLNQPKPDPSEIAKDKTAFCNFIYSNSKAKERIEFFYKLSRYKKVDSAGTLLNNMGGQRVKDKRALVKNYKFTIAFENSSYPGYTTEKITDPMLVYSLPVYWGNPLVNKDFNTKSFINCHDYKNFNEVIERIIEIDKNDNLYQKYLSEPFFENHTLNEFVREENILNKFEHIIETKGNIKPVAESWHKYLSYGKLINRKINKIKYKYLP